MPMRLAGAVIKNSFGQILLVHRNTPSRQQWEIPGGKVESGEKDIDAAFRELLEELGVEIEISKRLGMAKFKEGKRSLEYVWYGALVRSGTPTLKEPHLHDDLRFFDLAELLSRDDISANTRSLLRATTKIGLGQVPIIFWEQES
jgi:8-oxo-dGTP diphosphatase